MDTLNNNNGCTTTNDGTIAQKADKLPFVCPKCGSAQMQKSVGGYLEQVLAQGATMVAKSFLLGDAGKYTRGAERKAINKYVPFQHVCDYCHNSLHVSLADIEKGKYSMSKEVAEKMFCNYNNKLEAVKKKEVDDVRSTASMWLSLTVVGIIFFLIGLSISLNCEKETEGLWGMKTYTGTYIFAWFIMIVTSIWGLISGLICMDRYSKASQLKKMKLEDYAKTHTI